MEVTRRKNVNWDLERRKSKLKKRIRRWWDRLTHRLLIRSYISDNEPCVVKAISLNGVYSIWECGKDNVCAYRLIAMRYGLDMSVSDTCVAGIRIYSITLKKRQ